MAEILFRKSIAFRFMLYLLLFGIVITVLASVAELYMNYNKGLKTIQTRMSQIEYRYIDSLTQAVWDLDDEQIQSQLSGILSLPDIIYVEIKTKYDSTAQGSLPKSSNSIKNVYPLIFKEHRNPEKSLQLGELTVYANLLDLNDRLRARAGPVFLIEALKIFLLASFVLFIFHIMVTRHLKVMAGYARKLNIERLDTPLVVNRITLLESSNDELAQVISAINEMRVTLLMQLTERKLAEDALAEQWELLNNVLSNIPSSIFWKNKDLEYVGCNHNFALDANLKNDAEIVGYTDYDLPWAQTEAEFYHNQDMEVLSSGTPSLSVEMTQHQANGKVITCLVSKVPLKGPTGDIIGILGLSTDITQMKEAERQIRELNDNLEHKIQERTRQLAASNDELTETLARLNDTQDQLVESEKMAALGSLVAGIAHEINEPIRETVDTAVSLKANSDKIAALMEEKKLTKSDFKEFIHRSIESTTQILENLERAAELVRGFKQVAVDQSSDKKREFNVLQYMKEIMISLNPMLKKTKCLVEIDCPENINIFSNPGSFSQIISSLVSNALIHGFENNPETQGKMTINVKQIGTKLVVIFHDNGKGIPEETIANIFEPFYTTLRGTDNSGLGLHIVYNIVQSLNGNIVCESILGEGTTFIIRIPMADLSVEKNNDKDHESKL